MKRIGLICVILMEMLSIDAQNLQTLDKINGFKKFKFGTPIASFNHIEKKSTSIHLNGVSEYIYRGKDILSVYGIPVNEIDLSFYKGKLYEVLISFGSIYKEYTQGQFNMLQQNLEANFGHQYLPASKVNNPEVINGYIWVANKVSLESLRILLPNNGKGYDPQFNYIVGYLLFSDMTIKQKQQRSEVE